MPLVKNAAASLNQGVSQQAESQRYPSQASEQINAYSSPIKGLVKRPPTKFINTIGTDSSDSNRNKSFVHTINRDSSEQYAVVINPQEAVDVTDFTVGTNKVTAAGIVTNDVITFLPKEEGAVPPTGIDYGVAYYALENSPFTFSKTQGGTAVPIGESSILNIRTEAVYDYAGEQWIDGVFHVTFPNGHSLKEGDKIQFSGLSGNYIKTQLPENKTYILHKPSLGPNSSKQYLGGYDVSTSNAATVSLYPDNRFILVAADTVDFSSSNNYGYVIDSIAVNDTTNYRGWVQLGDGSASDGPKFSLWNNYDSTGDGSNDTWVAANGSSGDNVFNTVLLDPDDESDFGSGNLANWSSNLSQFDVGDLIRIGGISNPSKVMRGVIESIGVATVNSVTYKRITFTRHMKAGQLFDNTTGKWCHISFWGDVTNPTTPATHNPRQVKDTEVPNTARVGTNGAGTIQVRKSNGVGGVAVYDLTNGQQQTVNVESGLEYLTTSVNPNEDITAVTVADYTFLVNKTKTVKSDSRPKYKTNYEAFIETRTADYGKTYTIKVGGETDKENVAESNTDYPRAFFAGRNDIGNKVANAFMLRAKTKESKYLKWTIRIIQNWEWKVAPDSVEGQKTYDRSDPSPTQALDLLPPLKYRQDGTGNKVGIEFDDDNKVLNIWANFHFARNGLNTNTDVLANLTTVKDIRDAVANHSEASQHWDVLKTDGSALDDTNDATALAYTLFEVYISKQRGNVLNLSFDHDKYDWQEILINVGEDEIYGDIVNGNFTEGLLTPSATLGHYQRHGLTGIDGAKIISPKMTFAFGTRQVVNGEYYYKTPKWTGNENQQAIGTNQIAEKLASDARLALDSNGAGQVRNWTSAKRADGASIVGGGVQHIAEAVQIAGQEECLGLTSKKAGTDGILQKISEVSTATSVPRIDGHTQDWLVKQDGYMISIQNPENTRFAISVADDLGGNGLKMTYYEADEAADLPAICRHGHVVKIVGNAREEADDYYLRFEGDTKDNTKFEHGRWVECVGYDTKYKFDNSTMPVGLVRESDGTFTLKELDWDERKAGDDLSNPFPSFTNTTINDIFLFRNRLGILSGENVIFSESGEYFNFFRTTTAALLDSAPIDVTASTNKVSTLRSAVPYNERLILFSDQTQFVLEAEPFLSVKTVTLTPSNEIDSISNVKPVLSSNSIFYGFKRAGYSGVGELGVSIEDADQIDAEDVTSHIPKYIKGSLRKLAAATNEKVVCGITDDTTAATLYVYKFFNNAQNQRVQSAWFKYTFGTANDYITDISFIANTLYMVVRRSGSMYLEAITFEDDVKDTGMDYEVCLDHRVDKAAVTINGTTSITMPTGFVVSAATRLVTDTGVQLSSSTTGSTFTPQSVSSSPSAVAVPSNNFFIGVPYTMEYTFSQPFLKHDRVTDTGRYQIQRAFLEYANARSFTVDVIHNPKMDAPNKNTITNTYANDSLHSILTGSADLQEGFFKFGVQERNDRLQIVVKNDTPYPSDFLSIDYEARTFARGSRWRG